MNTLIILVKNPVAGRTKTRLATSVGHEMALKMYQMLMDHTQQQAGELQNAHRRLLYSESVIEQDGWPDDAYQKGVQRGADLGARMQNAFEDAFAAGASKAVIIGSDCPGVTTELLQNAFKALDDRDVVIGPALDGGYYLLGMKNFHPELFSGIDWSTSEVAKQTRTAAIAKSLTVSELTPLSDVDYLEDWQRYGWELPK